MTDIALFSIFLTFFLALVAIIGHAIWIAVAGILKALFLSKCPDCGHKHFSSHCIQTRPTIHTDLEAVRRVMEYDRAYQILAPEQRQSFISLFQRLSIGIGQREFARPAPHSPSATQTAPVLRPKSDAPILASVVEPGTKPKKAAQPQPAATRPSIAAPKKPLPPPASPVSRPLVSQPPVSRPPVSRPPVTQPPAVHPLDMPIPAEVAKPQRAPMRQRLTADLLRSFMEKSNIHWIELISAALVVICSVGLVISLWSTLSSTSRFFPSLVFLLATVGVHAAGQYTLRQWKLKSTSRGILHIGLMLIPLAVLVGILLSKRDGVLPSFDAMTIGVVGIGTLVYGALAFTASKALFARRWPIVAAAVIFSSLSLIPIHYLGQRQLLDSPSATLALLPLLATSCVGSILYSRSSVGWTRAANASRRIAAGVTQCLFATCVALVFWAIQSRFHPSFSPWWWVASGAMAAIWASWGIAGSTTTRTSAHSTSASWQVVFAWCVAVTLSTYFVYAAWHTTDLRLATTSLLVVSGLWWLLHGWQCTLRTSLVASALALALAGVLLCEIPLNDSAKLLWLDWISFPRVVTLSTVGLLSFVLSQLRLRPALQPRPTSPVRFGSISPAALADILAAYKIAAGFLLSLAALLTTLASLVPWGNVPYGGNWAPFMLLGYGSLALAAGLWTCQRPAAPSPLQQSLLPIGQAILMLGTYRVCQNSPILETWLAELRPTRAWIWGAFALSAIWAAIAAGLRYFATRTTDQSKTDSDPAKTPFSWLQTGQYNNLNFLSAGVVGLLTCSSIAVWTHNDALLLASKLGWILPLCCGALFYARREPEWREWALLVLTGYGLTVLLHFGWMNTWWSQLGLASASAIFVLVAIAIVCLFEITVLLGHSTENVKPRNDPSDANFQHDHWISAGRHWASVIVVTLGWMAGIASALGPAAIHLGSSLGMSPPTTSSRFVDLLSVSPDNLGFGLILLSFAGLTATSLWLGLRAQFDELRNLAGIFPVAVAIAITAWIQNVYALPLLLWTLATWLIASDLLPTFKSSWQRASLAVWRCLVAQNEKLQWQHRWLLTSRVTSLAVLAAGTLAFISTAFFGNLPTQLITGEALAPTWTSNLGIAMLSIGPLASVLAVRWILALVQRESAIYLSGTAQPLALLSGAAATIALTATSPFVQVPWGSAVCFTQATALIASILAWLALVPTGLEILRKRQIAATLALPETQRVREASWQTIWFAAIGVIGLSALACGTVIFFPARQLPLVTAIGSPVGIASAVTTAWLAWLLTKWRGVPHFTITAAVLGLLAPLASAFYAARFIGINAWLTEAAYFEPYRMLVALWLLALVIGLFIRIWRAQQNKTLDARGEAAWIILSILVGSLGLIGTAHDPNPWWPLSELAVLSALALLSGIWSGQIWRTHVAAVLAAAALSVWAFQPTHRGGLMSAWVVLWGPVCVAALAALCQRLNLGCATASRYSVHRSVSVSVPISSIVLSFAWVLLSGNSMAPPIVMTWWIAALGLASLGVAVCRLWESQAGGRGLGVYLSVVAAALMTAITVGSVYELPRLEMWLVWLGSGLSALAVMAGLTRELNREASHLATSLRLPWITEDPTRLRHAIRWMPVLHTLVALIALLPSVLLVLAFEERTLRITSTILPFLGALSILPLASLRTADGPSKGHLLSGPGFRHVGLLLLSTSFCLLWWAGLPSPWAMTSSDGLWMFFQRAFVALLSLATIYPILARFIRNQTDWHRPLMQFGWGTFALGVTVGCILLAGQFAGAWKAEAASVAIGTKLMTLLAWCVAVFRLLQFALRPQGMDQLASDNLRKASVYAAEVSLALFSAACYFHFPDLFSGIFVTWWPLVVFAIAMLSAALGEWLHRQNNPIISDPIRQSSLLMPLIPLAGVWFIQPDSAMWNWSDWDRYAFLLLSASAIYALHSWLRGSVQLRAAAVLLALLSFWTFLHSQTGFGFLDHPQFWLTPPALLALCFIEFNRQQLAANVVLAGRYTTVLMIYLSSTSEVFLKAFEGSLWQPLLLLVLALIGAGLGIIMRIKAFLYSGTTFTLVALLGMVWHAQQAIGQVWPWWAFGITTGVCMTILLGYFEKNRPRVLAYLEQLKQWES